MGDARVPPLSSLSDGAFVTVISPPGLFLVLVLPQRVVIRAPAVSSSVVCASRRCRERDDLCSRAEGKEWWR
ncbi:hypothetical protein GCM10023203_13910 [Actinomycetospora straminea]|uniref:Uncharacterized protein n=1 Tax=Actinomycetospora straminea TaxID=663607 RepID=A0ABP9E2Z2_9PSEU